MAGDEFRFALEMSDDGIEVGILGNDIDVFLGSLIRESEPLGHLRDADAGSRPC